MKRILFLIFIMQQNAFAQQNSSDFVSVSGMTFAELAAKMVTDNPEVAAAQMRIQEAEARLVQAGLRPNPRAEYQDKGIRVGGSPHREQEFTVSQPIETGGRRGRRLDVAQLDTEKLRYEAQAFQLQKAAELKTLVVRALAEVSRLQVLENMTDVNERLRSATLMRVSHGDASRYETTQTEAEAARLTSERIRTATNVNGLVLEIKTIVGMPLADRLQLRPGDFDASLQSMTPDDAVRLAIDQRPDLKAARLAIQIAEARVRVAESLGGPDLSAIVGWKHVIIPGSVPNDWLLKGGVSVGLPVFNRNQGQIREQALAAKESELLAKDAEDKVRRDVLVAITKMEQARRNVELYERSLVPVAQDAVRMAKLGFDLGELRFADYILEQRRLADVEMGRVQTRTELLQALVEIEKATGRIK